MVEYSGVDMVTMAREIALSAHSGQVDKGGNPYINHLATVAYLVDPKTPETQATAYLHDLIEDTDWTLERIKAEPYSMPQSVIDAVAVLTKDRKMDYFKYLKLVKQNPIARAVKIADIRNNSDFTRLGVTSLDELDERSRNRMAQYARALDYLLADD